jgi:hypothetical protein
MRKRSTRLDKAVGVVTGVACFTIFLWLCVDFAVHIMAPEYTIIMPLLFKIFIVVVLILISAGTSSFLGYSIAYGSWRLAIIAGSITLAALIVIFMFTFLMLFE